MEAVYILRDNPDEVAGGLQASQRAVPVVRGGRVERRPPHGTPRPVVAPCLFFGDEFAVLNRGMVLVFRVRPAVIRDARLGAHPGATEYGDGLIPKEVDKDLEVNPGGRVRHGDSENQGEIRR
jgi:hypothetical protein